MTTYAWRRYWVPREGTMFLGDGGFLNDPESKYASITSPDLAPLEALQDVPCLVLLGEPGIGKSTVVRDDFDRLVPLLEDSDDEAVFFDLRSSGSEAEIIKRVFEGEAVRRWQAGTHNLYLYLDSLDECRVRVSHLAALLVEHLKGLPHARLRIRLACRTAEWPALLETELRNWYGEGQSRVLELAPLTRKDVLEAAAASGLNPGEFLEGVHAAAAESFAMKPLTLSFLLQAYERDGALPDTQAELYELGCESLCREQSLSRIAADDIGRTTLAERMWAASWIAAAMTLAGKSVIRLDGITELPTGAEIDIEELTPERGPSNLSSSVIREVLTRSGLFSARGVSRLGWAHKTYAEYLAARFVSKQSLGLPQILQLVMHHEDDRAVIPQLREAGAWIASLRTDVFRELATRDPQVLLSSDVTSADEAGRQQLVQHLLESFDRGESLDDNWDERRHYRKLGHDGIAAQLRPYINDNAKNIVVRRVAVQVAEACAVRELEQDLLHVALDPSDDNHIRCAAALAVGRIGDDAVRIQLKPLLKSDATQDPRDELRGAVLTTLYPKLLTTGEVFSTLAAPRDGNLHGSYAHFFYELPESLKKVDLTEAIPWAAATRREHRQYGPVPVLHDAILKLAWQHADDPTVLPGLTDLVAHRLEEHENPFGAREEDHDWRPDRDTRRLVARELLERLDQTKVLSIAYGPKDFLGQEDLPWLLDELDRGQSEKALNNTAKLISTFAWHESNAGVLSRAIGAADTSPVLRQQMARMLDAVALDSPEAEEMREHERWRQEHMRRASPQIPDLAARVAQRLRQCEDESINWWWDLTQELSLKEDSVYYNGTYERQVSIFPGWAAASSETRARVTALAKRFLIDGDPQNDIWFGKNKYGYWALGGYRALELVHEMEPEWLQALDAATFSKWVPIVVAFPSGASEKIAEIAGAKCRTEVLQAVMTLLDGEEDGEHVHSHRFLDHCWNESIATYVLDKLRRSTAPAIVRALLEQGLRHGEERFVSYGKTLAVSMPSDSKERREFKVSVFALLACLVSRESWGEVWRLMQEDAELARDIWLAACQRFDRDAPVVQALSPEQLADLYIWLAAQFPPEEYAHRSGRQGPREEMASFRDAVLRHLQQRGDKECLAAMERVIEAFPERKFLRYQRALTRRAVVQATWRPPSVREVARLAQSAERRLVISGEHLQQVVLESLARFQKALHGELSEVRVLWNKSLDGAWHPLDEPDLSDRVAAHLKSDLCDRGIVANREVKIRRGLPGAEGQSTDIYVDAMTESSAGQAPGHVSLIIEVKGCWHEKVKTAMQDQLVERYMAGAADHGLYLVGYFGSDGWSDKDERKKQALRLHGAALDKTRTFFETQAKELSRGCKKVGAVVLDARLHKAAAPS